jgi:outer membrane receptor protein involved in Fe transport
MFSRATRAPNIGELFSSLSQTFPAIVDPCDQNGGNGDLSPEQTAGGLPALSAACRAIPGVSNTIAQRGAFYYSTSNIQTVDGLLGGNRNLREEEADTFTAGAVFQPSFLRNFSITADYYSIKVKNAIGIVGQQVSIDQCLEGSDPFFCNNVVRDPATGLISRVNAINVNTGSFLVSGIDLEARYMFDVRALGDGGKVSANVMWNHRFKQQQTPFEGGPVQDELGQADCYSCGRLGSGFKDRINGTFTAGNDKYTLTYNFNYMGPLVDNIGEGAIRIQPYMYHNLKATARFAKKYEFYIGVNNIADKTPPEFGDTNQVTWPGTQTVANTYDLYGRTIFFGTNLKF